MKPRLTRIGSIALVLGTVAACSEPPPEPSPAPAPAPAEAPEAASAPELGEGDVATAEAFIDAFYAFDPEALGGLLESAGDSKGRMLWYQGWAEGGHYTVVERGACTPGEGATVICPITVEDDPVKALGTGFNVTDTFALTFSDGVISSIETSSNDQPIYYAARKWVEANMADLVDGPCNRDPDVAPLTPGDCARAMTQGYATYAASEDFLGIDYEGEPEG